jgi:hypothetical protein
VRQLKRSSTKTNYSLRKSPTYIHDNVTLIFKFTENLTSTNEILKIITGHVLDDLGSIHGRGKDGIDSLYHRVQTDPRAHPASYPMGKGGSFPRGKLAGA